MFSLSKRGLSSPEHVCNRPPSNIVASHDDDQQQLTIPYAKENNSAPARPVCGRGPGFFSLIIMLVSYVPSQSAVRMQQSRHSLNICWEPLSCRPFLLICNNVVFFKIYEMLRKLSLPAFFESEAKAWKRAAFFCYWNNKSKIKAETNRKIDWIYWILT